MHNITLASIIGSWLAAAAGRTSWTASAQSLTSRVAIYYAYSFSMHTFELVEYELVL